MATPIATEPIPTPARGRDLCSNCDAPATIAALDQRFMHDYGRLDLWIPRAPVGMGLRGDPAAPPRSPQFRSLIA